MKKIILMTTILLTSTICYAGEVLYPFPDGTVQTIIYDDKYSFKDFTQRNLLEATDLEGKVIYASSFSQENPDTKVFPENIKKMTFYNCNLDNVKLNKPGWIVIGGSEHRYKVQTDRNDWLVNSANEPIEPLEKEKYFKIGISIDPKDLPLKELKENIIEQKKQELNAIFQ